MTKIKERRVDLVVFFERAVLLMKRGCFGGEPRLFVGREERGKLLENSLVIVV